MRFNRLGCLGFGGVGVGWSRSGAILHRIRPGKGKGYHIRGRLGKVNGEVSSPSAWDRLLALSSITHTVGNRIC
jgi:hypothetical protein